MQSFTLQPHTSHLKKKFKYGILKIGWSPTPSSFGNSGAILCVNHDIFKNVTNPLKLSFMRPLKINLAATFTLYTLQQANFNFNFTATFYLFSFVDSVLET